MEINISKKELEKLRRDLKFHDPIIFEKSIYAFRLLQGLLKVYPHLIFKGGTSILLHKFPPIRFSIDVDIILNPKDNNSLDEKLKGVAVEAGFKKVEEDIRQTEKNTPKKHFKFYYDSHYVSIRQYILLDIIFCQSPYSRLIQKSLSGCPLSFGASLRVFMPTIEGLFGDKLTAISPNTVGIPLNTKEMEFVKQIIDLAFLFEFLEDIEDVRKTFNNTVKFESSFRDTRFSTKKVIDDILDVAFKYCQYLLKGGNNSYKEIIHINNGLRKVSNHLLIKYTQSDLKIAFSKIAYICKLFITAQKPKILKTADYKLIENKYLAEKYRVLDGLKKTNPQGYFYWTQAFGM